MKKLINNLRQKPPHVRRMIAFVTSIAVTGIVGLIWISNLIALSIKTPVETAETKTPSPFALMYGQIKDFVKSTGNQMAEVSSAFNFMQSSTTPEIYPAKDTVATSSDGTIGISTTNYDTDNSSVTSLTVEQ